MSNKVHRKDRKPVAIKHSEFMRQQAEIGFERGFPLWWQLMCLFDALYWEDQGE